MEKIKNILMIRDELSEEEAEEIVKECKERIKSGEDPEEVLYDLELEIDYLFDLLF